MLGQTLTVIPAKAGIQIGDQTHWFPAFAGTTSRYDRNPSGLEKVPFINETGLRRLF